MSKQARDLIERVRQGESAKDVIHEGGVTKGQKDALVKAFALKIYSAKLNAPFKVQQRYEDKFMKLYNTLSSKYSQYDMTTDAFWSSLESAADRWWKSRPSAGTSVDW